MPDDPLVYPDLRLDRFDFDSSAPQREYADDDDDDDDDDGSTVPIIVVQPTTSNKNLWQSSFQQQKPAPLEAPTVRYQAPDHSNTYNNNPNRHQSSAAESSPPQASIILVAILMALIFILVAILVYLLLPIVHRCIGAKLARSPRRIQRRYETIEGWLITKKVRAHCPTCEQLQQQYKNNHSNSNATTATITTKSKGATTKVTPPKADPNRNVQLSPSYDTAETEPMEDFDDEDGFHNDDEDDNYFQHECTICYEALAEGDLVSWSPRQPTHSSNRPKETSFCQHVFHHECIKEWLLHHDTCPCCRITFLPIDQSHSCNNSNSSSQNDDGETTTTNSSNNKSRAYWGSKAVQRKLQLRNWVEQRSHRLKTTYYCLQEGLVTLDVAVSQDGGECHSKKQQSRFVGSGISPAVLARLRTSRSLTITATTTASSSPSVHASEIIHRPQQSNNSAPAAANPSPQMHPVSSASPLVVLINRCHSAPSSTNSTAAPQPLSEWRSHRPAWRGTVDLDLCLQQLRVLDGRQGFPFRSSISGSSSSSDDDDDDDDDDAAEEELYLESSSSSNGGSSTSSCSNSVVSSTIPPPPPLQQHLHMSHVVVGDIEMCLMKQQEQNQQQEQQQPRPVDWESASF